MRGNTSGDLDHGGGERRAIHHRVVKFAPLGTRCRVGRFLVENGQCAAQRHARRQQAGKRAREIFQRREGDLLGLKRELAVERRQFQCALPLCCRFRCGVTAGADDGAAIAAADFR